MVDRRTARYLENLAAQTADHWFVHRVVGVNLRNEDGSNRKRYVRRSKPLDRLTLGFAPRPSDAKAIGVFDRKGRQLGILDRRCASETLSAVRAGAKFEVLVAGRWQDPHGDYGLVVAMFRLKTGSQPPPIKDPGLNLWRRLRNVFGRKQEAGQCEANEAVAGR